MIRFSAPGAPAIFQASATTTLESIIEKYDLDMDTTMMCVQVNGEQTPNLFFTEGRLPKHTILTVHAQTKFDDWMVPQNMGECIALFEIDRSKEKEVKAFPSSEFEGRFDVFEDIGSRRTINLNNDMKINDGGGGGFRDSKRWKPFLESGSISIVSFLDNGFTRFFIRVHSKFGSGFRKQLIKKFRESHHQQQQQSFLGSSGNQQQHLTAIDFTKFSQLNNFRDFAKRNVCKIAKAVAEKLGVSLMKSKVDLQSQSGKHIAFEVIPEPLVFNVISDIRHEGFDKVLIYTDMASMHTGGKGLYFSHPSYDCLLLEGMRPERMVGSFQPRPPPISVQQMNSNSTTVNDVIRNAYLKTVYPGRPSDASQIGESDIKFLRESRPVINEDKNKKDEYDDEEWQRESYGHNIKRFRLQPIVTLIR